MEAQTLTFEDKEYEVDTLSQKAQYFVTQIQDLRVQSEQIKLKLDQVEIASRAFTDLLGQELNESETEFVAG